MNDLHDIVSIAINDILWYISIRYDFQSKTYKIPVAVGVKNPQTPVYDRNNFSKHIHINRCTIVAINSKEAQCRPFLKDAPTVIALEKRNCNDAIWNGLNPFAAVGMSFRDD